MNRIEKQIYTDAEQAQREEMSSLLSQLPMHFRENAYKGTGSAKAIMDIT